MSYAQFEKRLRQLERPRQISKIVEVMLIGQDEPDPPPIPGVEVIEVRLGDPSRQEEAAGT